MSFIEIIMVMVVIGTLAAVLIPKFDVVSSSKTAAEGAAYMIASDIRYAQEFAMANGVSKSVLFTSGSSLYTFSPTHNLDSSGRLPSGVTISNNFTVTFNSLGEPTTGGGGSVAIAGGTHEDGQCCELYRESEYFMTVRGDEFGVRSMKDEQ